jgi:hypothetical protein
MGLMPYFNNEIFTALRMRHALVLGFYTTFQDFSFFALAAISMRMGSPSKPKRSRTARSK